MILSAAAVYGNADRIGMTEMPFDMQPEYLFVDEIEHLKPRKLNYLLSVMEIKILTQIVH